MMAMLMAWIVAARVMVVVVVIVRTLAVVAMMGALSPRVSVCVRHT